MPTTKVNRLVHKNTKQGASKKQGLVLIYMSYAPDGVEAEPVHSSACILVAGVWMRLLNIWTVGTVIVESGILFQAEMVLE